MKGIDDSCCPKEGGNAPGIKDAGVGYAGGTGKEYGVSGGDLSRGFSGGGALGEPKCSDEVGGNAGGGKGKGC